MKKQNYLRNRDLMRNIHLSKATYTWYIDGDHKTTQYRDYDLIACDHQMYEEVRAQLMLQAINKKRVERKLRRTSILKQEDIDTLTKEDYDNIDSRITFFKGEFTDELIYEARLGHHNRKLYENGNKRVQEIDEEQQQNIPVENLVVRVFTFEHIPELPDYNPAKVKKVSDTKKKVNFPPYKHYALVDGKTTCVAISHYNENKEFDPDCGYINDELAISFLKICERIASKSNWRGYSYSDDMQGQALMQLTSVGLLFNELFSSNPFSYYTSVINNAFTVIFNQEKDVQTYRDHLLMENDHNPSWTQQIENEMTRSEYWDKVTGKDGHKGGEVFTIDVDDYLDDY